MLKLEKLQPVGAKYLLPNTMESAYNNILDIAMKRLVTVIFFTDFMEK